MPADGLIRIATEEDSEFQGIPIEIEHPKGSTRTGTGPDGTPWARKMQADYGFVPNTFSKGDNEDLDVYIGPEADAPMAYVVDQLKEDGEFDEVKVMLGFPDKDSAKACYLKHYPEGWESRISSIWELPVPRLKELVDEERAKNEEQDPASPPRLLHEAELRELARQSKAASLCVTDPTTKKRVSLRDYIKVGLEDAPGVKGEGRFLTLAELKSAANRAMQQPRFIKALAMVGEGRPWEKLSSREQYRVLYEEQRMSLGGTA